MYNKSILSSYLVLPNLLSFFIRGEEGPSATQLGWSQTVLVLSDPSDRVTLLLM